MGNENDPASLAKYYEAFRKLCENGYIEHAGGALFRLTAGGFEKARNLK
jgi:Mn-dependent DtxR family transcriptional regulator